MEFYKWKSDDRVGFRPSSKGPVSKKHLDSWMGPDIYSWMGPDIY